MAVKSGLILGASILTLLISSIAATAAPVRAGDINCNEKPNHEYCTGERGRGGKIFCDLIWLNDGDCYSRDYSKIDCNEKPRHARCEGVTGREGLNFCDLDPDADPCFNRTNNPEEYCAKYENEMKWQKELEFCESIYLQFKRP